jgi:hypothetical protein
MQERVQETAPPANTTPEHLAIVKANLDAAWAKVEDATYQEAEGTNRWIEGTLGLVTNLVDARERLGDQAFGLWLTENGYGEDRLPRHHRQALLNMGLDLKVTREVLSQTERRSWRYIWEKEIQPRLPYAGQPADGESPVEADPPDGNTSAEATTADANKPAEAPAHTRRPKKNGAKREANREKKPEWLRNIEGWYRERVVAAVNAVIDELNKTMEKCDPEQRKQLAVLDPDLLLDATHNLKKKADEFADWVVTPLEQAADALTQKSSRVVITPEPKRTPRASTNPEA